MLICFGDFIPSARRVFLVVRRCLIIGTYNMYIADAFVKFKEQQFYKHSAHQSLHFHSWFLNKVTKQANCVKYVDMNSKEKGNKSMCNITHW